MSSAASRKEKSKSPKLMWDFRDFFVVFKRTIFVFCFSHCLFSFHRFGSPFLSDSSAFLGFRWNLFFRNLCVFLACFLASQRFCFCFYFLDAFSSPRAEHALIAFLTIYRSIQVLIILWLGFASACCFSCHRCGVPASRMHFDNLKKEGVGRGGHSACPSNAQPPLLCHFFLCCLMLTRRTTVLLLGCCCCFFLLYDSSYHCCSYSLSSYRSSC